MKRILAALMLGAFLLAGWTIAQPPQGDTQEPPVRLKKKKKSQPDKPDPPEVKPEKPPEEKRKPKLDEDAELDPRDDVKLPRGEEESDADIMQQLTRNARLAEEKLAKREVGEGTRKHQEEVVKLIDKLLKQSNQDQQHGQDGKDPPPDGDSGADQKGEQNAKQRAQARAEKRKQKSGKGQSAQRGQGDQQSQQQGQGNNPGGGGGTQAKRDLKDPEKKFDQWGHLPEKERALMNKEMEQKFMEKYDDLTKQYYRTIAEKSRRK